MEKIIKELDAINAKLEKPDLSAAKRMELLRRQATLGDSRDAVLQAKRRDSAPPR